LTTFLVAFLIQPLQRFTSPSTPSRLMIRAAALRSAAGQTVAFTVSGDTASNNAAVEFPTATGTWGTVVAVGVFDALTSGNLLAYGNLTASKTIASGDVFRVPSGDLDITLD
jgi:hypothetical protein